MKVGIELSVNVSKIDETRLRDGNNGAKYMTATVWIDSDVVDKFGYHGMITMKQTKEEREAKTYTPIVGNGKMFWNDKNEPIAKEQQSPPTPQAPPSAMTNAADFLDDDLPF